MGITVLNTAPRTVRHYPYLGYDKESGLIVWFIAPTKGIMLEVGNSSYDEDYHMEIRAGWSENKFEVFNGTIEICQ